MSDDDDDTFTLQEMRVAMTAFAIWLRKAGWLPPSIPMGRSGHENELVDRFFEETL